MRPLTYHASLKPVPRDCADAVIDMLFETVPEVGSSVRVFPAHEPRVRVRLISGSHLSPGASYTVRGVRDDWPRASLLINSWSPASTTVVSGVVLGKRRGSGVGRVSMMRDERPGVLTATAALRPRPGKISMLELTVSADADLGALYNAEDESAPRVIAEGRVTSPAGTVSVEVVRLPSSGPRWEIEFTVSFSHWYTLPLLKSALMIERRLAGRRRLTDRLAEAVGAEELRDQAANDDEYVQLLAERLVRTGESLWNTQAHPLLCQVVRPDNRTTGG